MATFYEFGLSGPVIKATVKMGFEEATPIQEKTIPLALQGLDLIGQAQTGTGKTVAFGIPLVERVKPDQEQIQALVVAPTRELTIQVAEEINKVGLYKGVKALPIYGGQKIENQIRSLKARPQIIIGTPGRLMDHMRRKTIQLHQVTMVVLDEADEMLNMGFIEDIEYILNQVPQSRQTMLFSATMPGPVRQLAAKFMQDPRVIRIKTKEVTVPDTEQNYIKVEEKQKFEVLCRLLDIHSPNLAIVFGRTKRRVDELSEALGIRGYSVEGLHGDLTQAKRDTVLRHFREGVTGILVATDVAARGLDISGVTHVYNFDIPQDPESYVHRVGRTGRAGHSGVATTLVTRRELGQLKLIEQAIHQPINRKPVPTMAEAMEGQQSLTVEKILRTIETKEHLPYRKLAEQLLEESEPVSLLAASLKLLVKEPNSKPMELTEELPAARPQKSKRNSGGRRQTHYRKR